jgi:anionic cell wall polymer biosynthesis LytR-Cps2A-Psr (LCP) family protein
MVYKAIVFDEILAAMSDTSITFILIGIVLYPILNISGLLWGFYYLKDREVKEKKIASDNLHNLLKDIESFTNSENYDTLKWKLNEIGIGIKDAADKLSTEYETKKYK